MTDTLKYSGIYFWLPCILRLPVTRRYGFQRRLCVCLSVFLHDIAKNDAARITKLDIDMFHREFWKLIYFGFKR